MPLSILSKNTNESVNMRRAALFKTFGFVDEEMNIASQTSIKSDRHLYLKPVYTFLDIYAEHTRVVHILLKFL